MSSNIRSQEPLKRVYLNSFEANKPLKQAPSGIFEARGTGGAPRDFGTFLTASQLSIAVGQSLGYGDPPRGWRNTGRIAVEERKVGNCYS